MSGDAVNSLHIRTRSPEDDARIVEILAAVAPYWPPITVEELRREDGMQPENASFERCVAAVEGAVVGTTSYNRIVHTDDPAVWHCQVAVDPTRWSHGIGGRLYDHLLQRVTADGARRLKCHVREDLPNAIAFLERRGFWRTGFQEQLSRLEVRTANLEKCRAAAVSMEEGIRIATLAELGMSEELLHAIYMLDNETTRDIPTSDPWTSMSFDFWRKYLELPGFSPDAFWVAMTGGRPVGMAVLVRKGGDAATNGYTGVDRAYRGKGIARALKLRTVEWAREHGIEFIYTGNSAHNKPMLAINIDMGYKVLPAEIDMEKTM